jgi:hypothetical protein
MTAIVTPAEITAHLDSMTAVELRKLGAANGIKGASKGKKADLVAAIAAIRIAEAEALAAELAEQELAEQDMTEVAAHKDAVVEEELAKKARRSRMGMVIVAKGTEVHKSETFRAAAEALGWNVKIEYTETGEVDEDGEAIIRHHAVATKGGAVVEGSWIGKAWDYPNAGAGIGGKARKVRNLKEALRILQHWM